MITGFLALKLAISLVKDPTKCLKIMQEISELPITPEVIKHSRGIVQTLKKVCVFAGLVRVHRHFKFDLGSFRIEQPFNLNAVVCEVTFNLRWS